MAIKVSIQLGPEDGPWFAELLRSIGDAEITVLGPEQSTEQPASVVREDILALLQSASPAARPLLEQFIAKEVTNRQAVQELGRGETVYARLYAPGPRNFGAYAFVEPKGAHVTLRLPRALADGCDHAFARNVKDGDPYAVRVRLTNAEAMAEALKLAGEAYERVLNGS